MSAERQVELVKAAKMYREFENLFGMRGYIVDHTTRKCLEGDARRLGFEPNEVDAAVDAALAAREPASRGEAENNQSEVSK